MLRTGGPGLDNPGCVAYVVSLDTELTQKVPFPCRKNKKKAGLMCTTSLSVSLFFLFWGRETASQAQMYHLLKLSQLFPFFYPHLCNTLGSYYCCIQCMNPIPGRPSQINCVRSSTHTCLQRPTYICVWHRFHYSFSYLVT